jgi:hypothetical protein
MLLSCDLALSEALINLFSSQLIIQERLIKIHDIPYLMGDTSISSRII